jgi:hypothetical protein
MNRCLIMKKLLIFLFLIGGVCTTTFGQTQAEIKEITGKVEIKPPQLSWVAAQAGTAVSLGTIISTGFNSTAVLDLGGSVLKVDPLTRLRIEELIEREGTVTTELFLRVGKVNAEVKTTAGLTQNFKLRSPVSTAAVRGTGFDYSGYELYVYNGNVTYENLTGQDRSYGEGEGGGTSGTDTPTDSQLQKEKDSAVNSYAAGPGGQSTSGVSGTSALGSTGSVIIRVPPIE